MTDDALAKVFHDGGISFYYRGDAWIHQPLPVDAVTDFGFGLRAGKCRTAGRG